MIFLSPMIQCHTELSPTSGVTWSSSSTTVLPSEEILFPLFQLSNNITRTQIYGSMMRKICSHHYKQQNTSKWLIREATQITLTQNVTHYCLNCTHVNYTRLLARLYTTLKLVFHYQIRYDTRCYFNVRSKANMSQLNLPHGTDNRHIKQVLIWTN